MADAPVFQITKFNLQAPNNGKLHRTDQYYIVKESKQLVIRRGQEFNIRLIFDQTVTLNDTNQLLFNFTTSTGKEDEPSVADKTDITLAVKEKKPDPPTGWYVTTNTTNSNDMKIVINSDSDCVCGRWNLNILSYYTKDDAKIYNPVSKSPMVIYILFNPWNEADQVFMPEEKERLEYVLNDAGAHYAGTHDNPSGCPWIYGQFSRGVVEAAFLVLSDAGGLKAKHLRDPKIVARTISRAVNSNDDGGVLVGCWDATQYSKGKDPSVWKSSATLLMLWADNIENQQDRSVKFGQCWIFSHVACAVSRAIGIAARPATCFESAHDGDRSVTNDIFFPEQKTPGESVQELRSSTSDSLWGFHVWAELWFKRPDLSAEGKYDGWQCIDATPQERSMGRQQCGPASRNAIYAGDVNLDHDTDFILAEVNSDQIYWTTKSVEPAMKAAEVNYICTDSVGKIILSRLPVGLPFSDKREDRYDVTNFYKPKEGTKKERKQLQTALLNRAKTVFPGLSEDSLTPRTVSTYFITGPISDTPKPYQIVKKQRDDVMHSAKVPVDYSVGTSIEINLISKNLRSSPVVCKCSGTVYSTLYTGKEQFLLYTLDKTLTVDPKGELVTKIEILPKVYLGKLTSDRFFQLRINILEEEDKLLTLIEERFVMVVPTVDIEIGKDPVIKQDVYINCSFNNPLEDKLTGSYFIVDGPSLEHPIQIFIRTVPAKGKAEVRTTFTPIIAGNTSLLAVFYSDQLKGVEGSIIYDVYEN